MFFFWRNRERPTDPSKESVATWNRLTRIQGIGKKPDLLDVLLVFERFSQILFLGEPQRLLYQASDGRVELKRCFGDRGCLTITMALAVDGRDSVAMPLAKRAAFLKRVRASSAIKHTKKVPIQALTIVFQASIS